MEMLAILVLGGQLGLVAQDGVEVGWRWGLAVGFAFASAQVLRMRADMFQRYRSRHSARIRMDLDGKTSIEVSFIVRLYWAT